MLDRTRLNLLREGRDGMFIAQCPACAEQGGDRKGEHLAIYPDGRYGCVRYPGEQGIAHRSKILALVGKVGGKKPRRSLPAPRPIDVKWDGWDV